MKETLFETGRYRSTHPVRKTLKFSEMEPFGSVWERGDITRGLAKLSSEILRNPWSDAGPSKKVDDRPGCGIKFFSKITCHITFVGRLRGSTELPRSLPCKSCAHDFYPIDMVLSDEAINQVDH